MARGNRHTPEQIVSFLRQIEVAVANGKTTAQASAGHEQRKTFFRGRGRGLGFRCYPRPSY
jgi:putative transposase